MRVAGNLGDVLYLIGDMADGNDRFGIGTVPLCHALRDRRLVALMSFHELGVASFS